MKKYSSIDITTPVLTSSINSKKNKENQKCNTQKKEPLCLSQSNINFYSKENILKQVYAMHNKEKPYFCDICYFKCPNYLILKIHLKDLHGKITRQVLHLCPYCVSTFSCYKKWKHHLIDQHKNKPTVWSFLVKFKLCLTLFLLKYIQIFY